MVNRFLFVIWIWRIVSCWRTRVCILSRRIVRSWFICICVVAFVLSTRVFVIWWFIVFLLRSWALAIVVSLAISVCERSLNWSFVCGILVSFIAVGLSTWVFVMSLSIVVSCVILTRGVARVLRIMAWSISLRIVRNLSFWISVNVFWFSIRVWSVWFWIVLILSGLVLSFARVLSVKVCRSWRLIVSIFRCWMFRIARCSWRFCGLWNVIVSVVLSSILILFFFEGIVFSRYCFYINTN